MFELSALRAAQVTAIQPPSSLDGSLLTDLAGREFRFAVPGVPGVRLPRDSQSLENLWKSVSCSPVSLLDRGWAAAVWTTLVAPASRVPLMVPAGCGQELAALAVVEMTGEAPALASVKIAMARRPSRYAQPLIHRASADRHAFAGARYSGGACRVA